MSPLLLISHKVSPFVRLGSLHPGVASPTSNLPWLCSPHRPHSTLTPEYFCSTELGEPRARLCILHGERVLSAEKQDRVTLRSQNAKGWGGGAGEKVSQVNMVEEELPTTTTNSMMVGLQELAIKSHNFHPTWMNAP